MCLESNLFATRCIQGHDRYIEIQKQINDDAVRVVRGGTNHTRVVRELDAKRHKALTLFEHAHEITAQDIAELFGYPPRSSTWLCQRWMEMGFLVVADAAIKRDFMKTFAMFLLVLG